MRTSIRLLAIGAIVLAGAVVAPLDAHAAPPVADQNQAETVVLNAPMQAVQFDSKIAAAHGYEIRTDRAGKQYSVKAGAAADAKPLNTVGGVCGTSMVQVTPIGNRQALIQTGFDVYTTVWDFAWTVHVVDDYGVSDKNWGGLIWNSSWRGTNLFTSSGTGWVYATVTSGIAWLVDGTICYSHNPWAQGLIW